MAAPAPTFFHLSMDSIHFTWDAYGATREEAARAFRRGWDRWCRISGADRDYWAMTDEDLAAAAVEVELGACYQDHGRIDKAAAR
jgi:hypothetical protein